MGLSLGNGLWSGRLGLSGGTGISAGGGLSPSVVIPAGYAALRVGSPGSSQLVRVGSTAASPRIIIKVP